MEKIRIALLDMNNKKANQGMRNIKEITEMFQSTAEETVEIDHFDVRAENRIPDLKKYDIFISSGGPGTPLREGHAWENEYSKFLDRIWEHNQTSERKKFLFLICHSFQLASIHWKLGNICERKSYSFGVMPIHKSDEGLEDELLSTLPDPFFAVDSRAYQFIEPDMDRLDALGMKITALEKVRPHIHLERAVMAIRFSEEIYGTQFHPEADPTGFLKNLEEEDNRNAMIETYGMEKFLETVDRMNDPDKILLTQSQILPRFLQNATTEIKNSLMTA